VKWYRLAAEQGHAIAQHNLGGMYEFGKGVPQNYKIAEKWYRLSEEQGNANARRNDHYEPRVCLASPNGRCSQAQLCSASPNGRCPEGEVYPAQHNN
jgi:TPR repeat protein